MRFPSGAYSRLSFTSTGNCCGYDDGKAYVGKVSRLAAAYLRPRPLFSNSFNIHRAQRLHGHSTNLQ